MYPDFSPGVFTEFWYVSKEINANRRKITNDFGVSYTEVVKYQLNWSDGSDVLREQLKVHVFTLLGCYTVYVGSFSTDVSVEPVGTVFKVTTQKSQTASTPRRKFEISRLEVIEAV